MSRMLLELSFQESGLDTNGNFYQEDLISQVTITEKFAPLIKIKRQNNVKKYLK